MLQRLKVQYTQTHRYRQTVLPKHLLHTETDAHTQRDNKTSDFYSPCTLPSCHVMSCHATSCHSKWCDITAYHQIISYRIASHHTASNTILHCTALYCTALQFTALHCTYLCRWSTSRLRVSDLSPDPMPREDSRIRSCTCGVRYGTVCYCEVRWDAVWWSKAKDSVV